MDEEFDILTAKVLADEASPEERTRLEAILVGNAGLRQEFAEMKSVWTTLGRNGQLVQALDAPPASIPPERLVQLQNVVRERFGRAAAPETPRHAGASSRQRRAAPDAGHSLNTAPEQVTKDTSLFAAFRQFLMEVSRRPRLVASFTLLLIVTVAAGILFSNRSSNRDQPDLASAKIAAYLVIDRGESEVRREGRRLALEPTTPLLGSDEVHLLAGAKAYLVTASGAFELAGLKRFQVAGEVESGWNEPIKAKSFTSRRGSTQETDALRASLFLPIREIPSSTLLVTTRGTQRIPLYSPIGSTANLTPQILWKNESGKTYDLTITDEFDPQARPLRLGSVVPPVEFTAVEAWQGRNLAKDGLYRITLSEAGKPHWASEYTFRTVNAGTGPVPVTPVEKLLSAFRILDTEPSRVGDALAELLALPEELAESELALRLKLLAFGRLGYQKDFDAVASELAKIDASR